MPASYTPSSPVAIPDPVPFAAVLLSLVLDATRPVGVCRAAATILVEMSRRDGLTLAAVVALLARPAGQEVG